MTTPCNLLGLKNGCIQTLYGKTKYILYQIRFQKILPFHTYQKYSKERERARERTLFEIITKFVPFVVA